MIRKETTSGETELNEKNITKLVNEALLGNVEAASGSKGSQQTSRRQISIWIGKLKSNSSPVWVRDLLIIDCGCLVTFYIN